MHRIRQEEILTSILMVFAIVTDTCIINKSTLEKADIGSSYLGYDEMSAWVRSLPSSCHNMNLDIIGQTAEGRSIYAIKISKDSTLPYLLIDAGIHAREWLAPAVALNFLYELCQQNDVVDDILSTVQIAIIPCLNPDGYSFSHSSDEHRLWRKNTSPNNESSCKGVDLNRNYDIHWAESGVSNETCAYIYPGPYPNSELETQSLIRFAQSLRPNLDFYISLHTYGQALLIPYGHQKDAKAPNFDEMMRLGEIVVENLKTRFNEIFEVGNSAALYGEGAGGSDDYMASPHMNLSYSYTLELHPTYKDESGFIFPANKIEEVANQMFTALQDLIKNARFYSRPQ